MFIKYLALHFLMANLISCFFISKSLSHISLEIYLSPLLYYKGCLRSLWLFGAMRSVVRTLFCICWHLSQVEALFLQFSFVNVSLFIYFYASYLLLYLLVLGLVGRVDFTVRHLSSATATFPSTWDFSNSQQCIGSTAHQVQFPTRNSQNIELHK